MTIDKIYIADFGKLTDLTVYPTGGLNIIYAPNESGKSTFLAFIKYMFYGTKIKKTKGDMAFKDRYMPWNGMPMSGSIEFTHCGKQYIISRTDGAKNGSRKLEVKELATGVLLSIDEPGHHFFSVGEKAFSDSCFVTDIFSITDSDDDILSLLSGSGADNASYTRVRNALEEKILSLSSQKRSSSEMSILTRKLNESQTEYISIKKEISDITVSQSSFENKIEAKKAELCNLDETIEKKDRLNLALRHNELSSQLLEETSNLEGLKAQMMDLSSSDKSKGESLKSNRKKALLSFICVALLILSWFIFKNTYLSLSITLFMLAVFAFSFGFSGFCSDFFFFLKILVFETKELNFDCIKFFISAK